MDTTLPDVRLQHELLLLNVHKAARRQLPQRLRTRLRSPLASHRSRTDLGIGGVTSHRPNRAALADLALSPSADSMRTLLSCQTRQWLSSRWSLPLPMLGLAHVIWVVWVVLQKAFSARWWALQRMWDAKLFSRSRHKPLLVGHHCGKQAGFASEDKDVSPSAEPLVLLNKAGLRNKQCKGRIRTMIDASAFGEDSPLLA